MLITEPDQMDLIEQWEFCFNKFELSFLYLNIQREEFKLVASVYLHPSHSQVKHSQWNTTDIAMGTEDCSGFLFKS